ncbi:MAG TPA: alkaline phosphatase family protein [Thermodesulfobacteriota bacterium]|nr:alkaline phosphatase family protein [Deltaproteobacteria bacterium]HNU70197.1 alkaline phosphatase family protein [Thermodesulfobacteriota bacterium]
MHPTVFIGLDGATFTILDPLVAEGAMPFLKAFMERGVRATLLSTPNPLTPPAWTSMMTGRNPGSHGVFDFIWAEERPSDHYFTLYNFRDIQCETVWSIASRQQGKICSLNFPLMAPAPAVNGYIVPGLVNWKHLRRYVYPKDIYDRIKALPGFNAKEIAWDFDLEKEASRGIPPEKYQEWIEFHIRRERQWFEIVRFFLQEHPCDLTGILFDGPDKMLHIGWRFLDPAFYSQEPTPWEEKIRGLILSYFRELDGFIERIAELAGPQARIVMGSDHGFGPGRLIFRVNTWLHEQGYLTWKDLGPLDPKAAESVRRLVERHFVLLDWEKTTAYARTSTSNGIYIRKAKGPGHTGVPAEQYESFRSELKNKLAAITDPVSGERIIKHIYTKEEAYPGENNEQAPDLTMVFYDHSFASILNKEPMIYHHHETLGTHYPEGVFLAAGPGIRSGVSLPALSIVDVAPTLLHSLGLEIPADFEGQLPAEAFEAGFLEQFPVTIGPATQRPNAYLDEKKPEALNAEEEEEIYKQMKALGYVE